MPDLVLISLNKDFCLLVLYLYKQRKCQIINNNKNSNQQRRQFCGNLSPSCRNEPFNCPYCNLFLLFAILTSYQCYSSKLNHGLVYYLFGSFSESSLICLMIVFHYITMNDVEKCIASFLKHLEGGKVSSSNIRLAFQLQVTKIVPGYSLLPSCNCKAESRKSCILLPLLVALMSQSPLPLLPPDLLYLVCAPGLENSK